MSRTDARTGPRGGGIFAGDNALSLSRADLTHWWFRGKAALVSSALSRFAPTDGWLIDIGAGSGGVTSALLWPAERRVALEGNWALISAARTRGLVALKGDVTALPVESGTASVVCLLDVIEHLEDPVRALSEARRSVRPDGVVVVTVPAHDWLWSATDEELGHHRRYTRSKLRTEFDAAGLETLWMSHAFSWCVPPVWFLRKARRAEPELGIERSSPLTDRLAGVLNAAERVVLTRSTLPIGSSVIAVGKAAAPGSPS